jgi:hypothetical protein
MSKALVYKATSDDTKAVSGFILKELARMFQSILSFQLICDTFCDHVVS